MVEFLSTFDLRLWLIETIPNVVFFFTFGVALLISLDFLQERTWRNYRTVERHEIVRGLITYKISELWAFLKTKITRKHKISCFEPMGDDCAIEDFLIIIIGVVLIVDIILLFMYSFLVYSFWITVFMMILIINVMMSILITRIRKKTIDKNEVYRIMKE